MMVQGGEGGKTGSNSKYILMVKVLEFAEVQDTFLSTVTGKMRWPLTGMGRTTGRKELNFRGSSVWDSSKTELLIKHSR